MKKHVLIYTDFGDTTDGLARVYGVFDKLENAQAEMQRDVFAYLQENEELSITYELDNYCLVGDDELGCQWQILTVNL